VGLAAAILHRPDLLVLDEPTEGLDPNQRVEIRRVISHLGRERTVILSTHVLPEVQFTCSRLLIINRGRIVADGPVDDLVSRAKDGARISVEAAGTGVADRLAELPGVRGVEPRPGEGNRVRVTVTVAGAEDLRPRVFELAKASGWTLFELHQEAGSLEDLFRQLTTDQEPA
jgi:ABC-2 type transport system ATP-binding protein